MRAGSGRETERAVGRMPERRDSNSLHVWLRASSTRPDSPPWRVDEVVVRDSGLAVVLHQPFSPNPISNPVQGIGGVFGCCIMSAVERLESF